MLLTLNQIKENTMRTTNLKKLDKMFVDRWSPRVFKKDPIPQEDIDTMFEAARWAPSCYNEQPWIFTYAVQKDDLEKYTDVMVEFNQMWASTAPMLVLGFARKNFERNDTPNGWAEFDLGSAFMSLTLQAEKLGYRCHAMAGFDPDKALKAAGLDEKDVKPMVVIAIGKHGDIKTMSEDLQKKEIQSDRKPLDKIVFEGKDT